MTTSEPTTQNHIQQTLFAVDSLAKISQSQADSVASRKKPDQVSFLNSCESFAWLDPNTLSWKTWQRSLITDWTSFSESFPKQGTMQNGQLYRQVLWEPVINEADGGSLPTPTTMDHLPQRSPEALKRQMEGPRKGRTKLANLREAVNPKTVELFNKLQSLPTPVARDYKGRSSKKWNQKYGHRNIPDVLTQTGDHMQVSPYFLEEVMGYPIGWTELLR
tara:strand:+ start:61 stop:717 length:657 start_codon:yes stop_codon:yes gene_type:complete